MSIIEIEKKMYELESCIEKAKHLIESFIENYDLDSTEDFDKNKMMIFATNRNNMFIEASMIHDYLYFAQNSAKLLKDGALV